MDFLNNLFQSKLIRFSCLWLFNKDKCNLIVNRLINDIFELIR